MKLRHVFAALLLACSVGQQALAQEETHQEAAPAQISSGQENKDAAASQEKTSESRTSTRHASRKHGKHAARHAKAEAAPEKQNDAPVKAENAAAEKTAAEKAVAAQPAASAPPAEKTVAENAAPEKAASEPAAANAEKAVPDKPSADNAAAQNVVAEKPAAEHADEQKAVPAQADAQPGWLQGFWYNIKATDVLIALFAGLTVLTARIQLRSMRETAKAATETAKSTAETALAAEKTARSAENALVIGQRAFMFLREFRTFLHLDEETGHYRWSIHPIWENSGNTPTKGLSIYTTYRLLDEPLPKDFDFPSAPEDMTASIAGPKGLVEAACGSINAEELAAVQQGKKYFYIWGRAEYHDIFEGTGQRTTRFCNQLIQVTGNPRVSITEHNVVQLMFDFHSENNSAD